MKFSIMILLAGVCTISALAQNPYTQAVELHRRRPTSTRTAEEAGLIATVTPHEAWAEIDEAGVVTLPILKSPSLSLIPAVTIPAYVRRSSECSKADIQIKSIRAGFQRSCETCSPRLRGVGVLANTCSNAIGVELRIVGLNSKREPVATTTFYPASVENIAPGEYTFSLDYQLRYDPEISSFTVGVEALHRW